jgi:O-succinylhomoserine sulfhydrylase
MKKHPGIMPQAVQQLSIETLAIRVGQHQDFSDIHSEGLALTASYIFDDAEDAAEKFAGRRPGNVYVRFGNPTTTAFEQRIAAMERAEAAVAVASGMAAIGAVGLSLLKSGDHVLLGNGMFGTTPRFFQAYLGKFGVSSTVVDVTDPQHWRDAFRPETAMVLLETPTNPMMQVADLRDLADQAREHHAYLVVDNTVCTPVYQNPLALGADLVVHSAAKYIDGQGRCGGGVVVGSEQLIKQIGDVLRTIGPSPSPFNSWIFLKSLETLPIRMREHSRNGQRLAEWLAADPRVDSVHYTGLPGHPQRALIDSQQSGHGGLLSFTVVGDRDSAWSVVDKLALISTTTNIGDTKSMITHPASTTHGRLSEEARAAAGITPALLRLSVGLEDPGDVIEDLDQALDAIS